MFVQAPVEADHGGQLASWVPVRRDHPEDLSDGRVRRIRWPGSRPWRGASMRHWRPCARCRWRWYGRRLPTHSLSVFLVEASVAANDIVRTGYTTMSENSVREHATDLLLAVVGFAAIGIVSGADKSF